MAKIKTNEAPRRKFDQGKYNFLGVSLPMGGLSVLLMVASLAIIATKGFNYGIDFAGGTEIQVQFEGPVTMADMRKFAADEQLGNSSVQKFGSENEFLLRFEVLKGATDKETNAKNNELIKKVSAALQTTFASQKATIRRVDSVGPQIGDELKRNGLLAVFYSLLMILIYVGLRFDFKYAPGAVICLFHDALITLGIFALLQKQVNVQILAAVLTIIGYSLNDTIVNFDRIRENFNLYRGQAFKAVINRAVNDVLSRTILTSVTTLLAVAALFFFAGGVIEDFAFTLGIGVFIGTYSSIYVASPLVLLMDQLQAKKA